ncbi:MAG: DUF6495 family protein [Flavobacteriales bacterium]
MPRFRLLTSEELQELEPEFKQFLIINELYDQEWRELADKDPQKAQRFLALFADIVLEKTYQKAQALVQIGHDFIALFLLQEHQWQLLQFKFESGIVPTELNTDQLFGFLQEQIGKAKISKGSKAAPANKPEIVHQMIQNGAQILGQTQAQQMQELFDLIVA